MTAVPRLLCRGNAKYLTPHEQAPRFTFIIWGTCVLSLGFPQLRAHSIAWISMRHSSVDVSLHGEKIRGTEFHCFQPCQPCLSFWSLSEIQQFGLDLLLLTNTNTIISVMLLCIWAGASDWKPRPGAWALVWLLSCPSNSWTSPLSSHGLQGCHMCTASPGQSLENSHSLTAIHIAVTPQPHGQQGKPWQGSHSPLLYIYECEDL